MVALTFPDGARRDYPAGTTGLDIAKGISPSLAKRTVAMAIHWSSVGLIGALGALTRGWITDHMPPAWSAWTLPRGASFSSFHVLILLQVLHPWLVALPLLAGVTEPPQAEV